MLSGGRALPAFGLGIAHPVEQQAFGVERGDRAVDLRRGAPAVAPPVDRGRRRPRRQAVPLRAHERAAQARAPARRVARRQGARRSCAGSVASPTAGSRASPHPSSARPARVTIEDAADAAGREIDPEHFGVMVLYTHDAMPDAFVEAIRTRNPDVEIDDLVARGWPGCASCASATSRSASRSSCSSRSPSPRLGRRARDRRAARSCPLQNLTTSAWRTQPQPGSGAASSGFEEAAEADDRADHADAGADDEDEDADPDRVGGA